jgi:ubiquinone/menaquinone biosynthesis C-methylase UbiE
VDTPDPVDADVQARRNMHGMWSSVADHWAKYADDVDGRSAELTARMLERASPRPGDRVLELACGPGGAGLAAAAIVSPGGEVVLSDVAPEMTAIAAARAAAVGLDNVRTRTLDIEDIDEPDASYDVVLCREGLMFAADHARGAREIARVVRPGGRVALAAWGPREDNPWLGVALDVVGAQLGMPMPPPGIPGPFSLSDASAFGALLTAAGLVDVDVDEVTVGMTADSFDEWWRRTTALAGPIATLLAALPVAATDELRARAGDAVRPYVTPDGLHFPGVSLLASARRG